VVKEFVHVTPEHVLRARIEGDQALPEQARDWRHRHVPAAVAAFDTRTGGHDDSILIDASLALDLIADRIVEFRAQAPARPSLF
jgi:hypothetical protein